MEYDLTSRNSFPKRLKKDEQEDLLNLYIKTRDPTIREELILHNLRLVKYFSNRLKKEDSPTRAEEDLFQEGIIGLMAALESYNPERGSFSGHAANNIKASLYRYLRDKERSIRLPAGQVQAIRNIVKAKTFLMGQLDRDPSDTEIGELLNITADEVRYLKLIGKEITSLDIPIGEEGDDTISDIIEDESSQYEDEVIGSILVEEFLKYSKEYLESNQYEAIRLSLGLNCREHTLKEIAAILDNSPEYARQLREKGLKKIRKSKFVRNIEKEVDERTPWIRGIDYSLPRVQNSSNPSPVERLVLKREEIRNRLIKEGDG